MSWTPARVFVLVIGALALAMAAAGSAPSAVTAAADNGVTLEGALQWWYAIYGVACVVVGAMVRGDKAVRRATVTIGIIAILVGYIMLSTRGVTTLDAVMSLASGGFLLVVAATSGAPRQPAPPTGRAAR